MADRMGIFDEVFEDVVDSLLDGLRDDKITLRAVEQAYSPLTGETVTEVEDILVRCTPPTGYVVGEIDNINILSTDSRILVSAKEVGDLGFSMLPESGVTRYVVLGAQTFTVVRIFPIYSGDRVAAYRLQLRLSP